MCDVWSLMNEDNGSKKETKKERKKKGENEGKKDRVKSPRSI